MIDKKNKVIFIHNPKTGGISIQNYYLYHLVPETRNIEDWADTINKGYFKKYLLKDIPHQKDWDPHTKIDNHLWELNKEEKKEYKIFTILRNPETQVHSFYYEHLDAHPMDSYKEYIESGYFKKHHNAEKFLKDSAGRYPYTDIFVFERLYEVFDYIDNIFGETLKRPHLKLKPWKTQEDNTDDLKKIVREYYIDYYNLWLKHYNNVE